MKTNPENSSQLSPEELEYLQGAPPEGREFEFLIGCWDCEGVVRAPDGTVASRYQGTWEAEYAFGDRMVIDTFRRFAAGGEETASTVTLRTYCRSTARWEMATLFSLRPQTLTSFHGQRDGEEMHLHGMALDRDGARVETRIRFHDIGEDHFEWQLEASPDGQTWTLLWTISAQRRRSSGPNRSSSSSATGAIDGG